MDTRYLKKIALYLISVLASLALIFYIVYHLMDGFTTDITTVTAELSTRQSVINADGYIFRSEKCIFSSYGGTVNYLVGDGEKVAVNQPLAEVFSDSSGYSIRSELSSIEKKLEIIDESSINSTLSTSDTSNVDKKISSYYHLILSKLAEGKYSHALRSADSLLVQMSRRQLITGSAESFSDLRAGLEARRATLTSQLSGRSETVFSESSGYFFNSVDGYENIFSLSELEKLSVSSFFDLISREPENTNGAIGKLSESYLWYIALPLSKAEASSLSTGGTYTGVFSYNYDTELSLKAEKILTEVSSDKAVAVFSCGEMPDGFNYLRSQSVSIVVDEQSGYRVPKTSVRLVDGEKGVYTLYGSTVVFKRIDILLETDGYYIVSTADPLEKDEAEEKDEKEEKSYPYIELYDQIIVSGKDLEDGIVFY